MDGRTEQKLNRIMYFSLGVILIMVVLKNYEDPWLILFLSGLLILSITVRHAISHTPGKLLFILDILLIFLIDQYDRSGTGHLFYYVVISDAVIAFPYILSAISAAISFISFAALRYEGGFYDILTGLIVFISVFTVMSVVKYQIINSQKLKSAMFELKIKTKQLEDAYTKIKQASRELEDMTILKERNRIAREIHDTVGHTLTTVLMELEAGECLIGRDDELAGDKIRLAKGQVRKGLSDIRESVGMLSHGREVIGFLPSIRLLIEETTRHGQVFVKADIGDMPGLSPRVEKALYRALQEGLTNGMKHGRSTAFVFKLKHVDNSVKFSLEDNGMGCEKLVAGFGLTSMEQRVREAGGIFNIGFPHGEGCCINITIPVKESR